MLWNLITGNRSGIPSYSGRSQDTRMTAPGTEYSFVVVTESGHWRSRGEIE